MQPKQIILVDDETRLLSALRRRLSSEFDIATFESGADALEYLSKPHNVAVIVADMQMPGMNGIELLKKVHDQHPDIRRLMLTGNSDQETAMAAINEGKVLRFIRKPCDVQILKEILNEALKEYEFNKADLSQIQSEEDQTEAIKQAQQTFLSIMSDELRTPLSQVITITNILTRDIETTEPETLKKFLNHINESGESALAHIDRILKFTYLQSHDVLEADKENIDIVNLFQTEIDACQTQAKDKLVSISVETLRKMATISGINKEITNAVHEVISNAIKYSDIGGHVSIIFRYDKDNIAVRVSNSGAHPQTSNRYSEESVFKHPTEGLHGANSGVGLGLSLTNLIAKRNDIVFNMQDGPNGGGAATFVFKRPNIEALKEAS